MAKMMVLMRAAETVSMRAAELGILEGGCDDGASVPAMDRHLSSEPSLRTKNLHCMRAVSLCSTI
jgi:hypothetical protein